MSTLHVSKRNALFQQWESLIANRNKRHRAGEFLVQGVRPISQAIEHGWPIRALIHNDDQALSDWATGILTHTATKHVAMSGELIAELSGKDDAELVAVVGMPNDEMTRIPPIRRAHGGTPTVGSTFLGLVFDRPTNPGNVGTVIRAADAFGASAVIVTGHAADPYDPQAVRASTGSLFAVPVVRQRSHAEVLAWVTKMRSMGNPLAVVGTDESGAVDVAEHDLTGPTLLVIGNETAGMSAGWREACDVIVSIPISGSASSLNAAGAATVCLYEAARQRG